MSKTTNGESHETLAEQLVRAATETKDEALLDVAKRVADRLTTAAETGRKILRPYYFLRALLVIGSISGIAAVVFILVKLQLSVEVKTWKQALEIGAQASHLIVVVPVLWSILFLERRLKRKKLLRELNAIERLIDETYEVQFNTNPYNNKDDKPIGPFLDTCCGLLFLIRMAVGRVTDGVQDQVVLDRAGNVRRGSENSHRNILIKIAMAQGSTAHAVSGLA